MVKHTQDNEITEYWKTRTDNMTEPKSGGKAVSIKHNGEEYRPLSVDVSIEQEDHRAYDGHFKLEVNIFSHMPLFKLDGEVFTQHEAAEAVTKALSISVFGRELVELCSVGVDVTMENTLSGTTVTTYSYRLTYLV